MDYEGEEDDGREYGERWMMKASYSLEGLDSRAWEAADWLRCRSGYAREVRELEKISERLRRIHEKLESRFARETAMNDLEQSRDDRPGATPFPLGPLARRVWWWAWRICR